jgi:PAS domain S-box-containing protein
MVRTELHFRKILIISCLLYGIFVVKYSIHSRDQAKEAVNLNSRVIAEALQHHNIQTLSEYLLAELKRYHYERIVITDNKGKNIIEKKLVQGYWIDRWLVSLKLIPLIPISANITYNQRVIGTIGVTWRCRTIYTNIYLLLALSLILAGLNFHSRILRAKHNLKDEVEERTIQLQKTNLSLKQSEERFHSLFEATMNVILCLSPDGCIVEFNTEAERLYGKKREEVVGKSFFDLFVHNNVRKEFTTNVKKVLAGTPVINFEDWVIGTNDRQRFFTWNISRMYALKGQVAGIICIGLDITEHKQSEIALRNKEQKLNVILDQAFQFFGLLDINGTLIEANKTALTFTGSNEADLKGKPFWQAPWWTHSPQLQQRLQTAIKRAADGKIDQFETEHIAFDHTIIYVDYRIKPVFNDHRHIIYLVIEGYDITARKKIEEVLAEKDRFLETLIDEIPVSIFYKNTKGKYTGCNKHYAELLGLKKDEIIGKNVYEVHKKELADVYFEADTRLFEAPGVHVYESQIDHSNGTRLDILINKATFSNKDGHVSGIIGVVVDISDRKRAEKEKDELESQLRQAQKMESIGTLAGGIAHDFNNILGAIMGFAELAQLDASNGTVLEANLNEVVKAANRAKELINQILTFSRQSEHKLKPLQLSSVIKEALKLLRASLPTTIEIHYDIKSDALAMANPTQIHQVLMNLCTNAGHAMRENGGLLEVSLVNVEFDAEFVGRHPEIETGPYLQLTVTDTGHGMSPEILNRVFDPFFSTKETGEGTGLGLSVVHGIVKSHGGMIYAYSEPGKGSSFKVYLPAIERRMEPEKREEKILPKGSERILFIDDEKMLVDVGKQLLETLGYDVTAKNSSIDALQLFTSHSDRFDLVITDQTMPHMTGEELATKLLVMRPDIPIIMCTGFNANITERTAHDLGIKSLIMKPIIMRDFARTIRRVLDENYTETGCRI